MNADQSMAGRRDSSPATGMERRFVSAFSGLNAQRRNLIRSILENPAENYFLSSRELARRHNVHVATIVRTIQALGYPRFADFAADLRRHFVARITPYTVAEAATRKSGSVAQQIRRSLEHDVENIQLLRSHLDTGRLVEFAQAIYRARRIAIIGVDLAAALSYFLAYALRVLGLNADAPVASSGNLSHSIRLLDRKDLLIGISFGRCLRETVEAMLAARRQGVPTIGITDADTTPIARYSDIYLVVSTTATIYSGSYAAPMALINAILEACSQLRPKRTLAQLRKAEETFTSRTRWYVDAAQ
jgi:DNA-binding MurR/RpiR family transcriptional regulator